MKEWPPLTETGDLPTGIHRATLTEVLERFGQSSPRRMVLGRRIRHIYGLVQQTGCLARCILYGSFITSKLEPNDVDIFLLMEDNFDMDKIVGEPAVLFDHLAAQNYAGASVFWLRRLAALDGEHAAVEHWQIKRGGGRRGIVEITGT
jgi:hypothetical protein